MNRFVVLFSILTVAFAALFVADLQGRFNVARDPVAILNLADGTVRRLGRSQLTWDRAGAGTLFGMGDTISTGEGAAARLAFYAGGELELDPGAMVVLSGDLDELKLNFVSGKGRVRVTKQTAKKFKVTRGPPPKRVTRPNSTKSRSPAAGRVPDAPESRIEVVEVAADELKIPPPPPAGALKEGLANASAPAAPVNVNTPTASAARIDAAQEPAQEILGSAPAIRESEIKNPENVMSTGGELASSLRLPPTPNVTYPEKDAVFDLSAGKVPELRWVVSDSAWNEYTEGTKDESAKTSKPLGYEIILRPAQGDGPAKILRSASPQLPLTRVSKGKYLWSVRTVTGDGKRSPASESRWLEVRVPAQIARPKILPVRVE